MEIAAESHQIEEVRIADHHASPTATSHARPADHERRPVQSHSLLASSHCSMLPPPPTPPRTLPPHPHFPSHHRTPTGPGRPSSTWRRHDLSPGSTTARTPFAARLRGRAPPPQPARTTQHRTTPPATHRDASATERALP
jgi:hypothetical protein